MSNDYQTRKDIDRLYSDLYSDKNLRAVIFKEGSQLIGVYTTEDKSDIGTLDAILDNERLIGIAFRVDDLENRIEELENQLNGE